MFSYAFAATASTILSGAVAGRMKFFTYVYISAFVSGFVYPVVAHWAFSEDGWLVSSMDQVQSYSILLICHP
eukprot:m.1775 g.1775  ORF g.1775 m.1775 type:complete len:72 (+) comp2572_c0_seq1:3-218(+)